MTEEPAAVAPHPAGHRAALAPGDVVLLVDRKGRRYLQRLAVGATFHYHSGTVSHDALIGAPEGCSVLSSKGSRLLVVRPTSAEWTVKAPRGAQVVYPKDQAMIVGLADIGPGAVVVEAGAGSGALTCALLRAVGPAGRVVSFELREDHARIAERNVSERFGGHPDNWELRIGDVADELASVPCDRVVLDVLEPARAVPAAAEALHPGGIVVAYTPTVTQVVRFRESLETDGRWGMEQTFETLLRGWHVSGLSVRPDHRMVAHTAFLNLARRLADERGEGSGAPQHG